MVEQLLADDRLWLPSLSTRRGFSSCRVEHLLNGLVKAMPAGEAYLEVGTLEGRTLESAALGNEGHQLFAFDHEEKYHADVEGLPPNVIFRRVPFEKASNLPPIGVAFYDGEHSAVATSSFINRVRPFLAQRALLVFDDWDRVTVRQGVFDVADTQGLSLLAELPSYTDGLNMPPNHFGFYFGVSVWSFKR